MSMETAAQDTRIRHLERELRRVRRVALCGILVVTTFALGGFRAGADDVVRAQRVELMNREGVRRAILSADSLGFAVVLLDERGHAAGSLRLSGEPRVAVENGRGRELAGLGAPKAHNLAP